MASNSDKEKLDRDDKKVREILDNMDDFDERKFNELFGIMDDLFVKLFERDGDTEYAQNIKKKLCTAKIGAGLCSRKNHSIMSNGVEIFSSHCLEHENTKE